MHSTGEADGVSAYQNSSDADAYAVFGSGGTASTGIKSAIVYSPTQGPTQYYVEESTEIYFSDYGSGQLSNGFAHISLNPIFIETTTIDSSHPMHIFIQPYGDAQMKVERHADSFDVIQTDGQDKTAEFSYRVVAKRKYYENRRLLPTNVAVDQFMRPDLSTQQRSDLNAQWGLEYIGDPEHALPTQPTNIGQDN